MSHQTYMKYRPEPYKKRMPIFWWVSKGQHVRFILRELTSVFIAGYAIVLILLIRALAAGPEAYAAFMGALTSPVSVILHVIALAMALYHTYTWFQLAPSAMVIKVGGKRVPPVAMVGGNFAAWAVLSAALIWLIARL